MRNTGRQRKRDSITAKLGVIHLVRLQRAVTPLSVVGDHLHIHGIVLRGKGTEAVPLFFKLGLGRKGDGLGTNPGRLGRPVEGAISAPTLTTPVRVGDPSGADLDWLGETSRVVVRLLPAA